MKRLALSPLFDREVVKVILERTVHTTDPQTRDIMVALMSEFPHLKDYIYSPGKGKQSLNMSVKQIVSYILTIAGFKRCSLRLTGPTGVIHFKPWRMQAFRGMDLDQRADYVMAHVEVELEKHENKPQTLDDLI